MQKGRIGCTNRHCQKLFESKKRARLVSEHLIVLWPSVNSHRRMFSRPSGRLSLRAELSYRSCTIAIQGDSKVKANKEFRYETLPKAIAAGSCFVHCSCGRYRRKARRETKASFPLSGGTATKATWLILPVVICLSQRLSHACLSINFYTVKLRMAH